MSKPPPPVNFEAVALYSRYLAKVAWHVRTIDQKHHLCTCVDETIARRIAEALNKQQRRMPNVDISAVIRHTRPGGAN